jgi:hypothetical protein
LPLNISDDTGLSPYYRASVLQKGARKQVRRDSKRKNNDEKSHERLPFSTYLEHLADHLLLGADEEAHDVIAQGVPVLVQEALYAVPDLTRVVLHAEFQRVHTRPAQ